MRSCRTASMIASGALLAMGALAACRETSLRIAEVPPVTSALPEGGAPLASGSAARADAAPEEDASTTSVLAAAAAKEAPVTASFVDVPGKVDAPVCSRLLVAVAKGKLTALGETLGPGDVLVVTHPEPLRLEGAGLALVVRRDLDSACAAKARPGAEKKVVRGSATSELRWAGGAMAAHLDVGTKLSPEVYLGRLEGTAPVGEHTHPASWEILAAVDASGTFVLEGTEGHLGPRQIVMVPPGAKHAWRPDPGAKLVAFQMYAPPGPEQRFVALAAAERDAGPAPARDAGSAR